MFSLVPAVLYCVLSAFVTLPAASQTNGTSPLDPSFYKDVNVTRGFVYHYYSSPPEAGKPVLLFLHGFPSSSYDWRNQIGFFQDQGYGLIVPDMLGYGGTAKPVDPHLYASSLITGDMVDLLDAEDVDEAIVIGHDWGAKVVARLANYFPERFSAFGFLSVGYFSPSILEISYAELNNITKQAIGYEIYGYWDFFSTNGTDQIIEDNLDSFFDITFTANKVLWITDFAPQGGLQAWLESNSTTAAGDFITPEDRAISIDTMRSEGMRAALCWYEVMTSTIESDDNQGIPQENLTIKKPVFLGAALEDYVAIAALEINSIIQASENATTIQQYDSGHWVMLEAKDQVNSDLLAWIESL
ncbi:MAG: Alpha/Beta hydrolase protein [Lentinula lateritia]|uniref:Alpha/Beta hydrolase protein n=1 Tax=Lentinula lateritia TaxID=40482 RepID=A0ABQ8VJA7_9AGAR|nr:MAG: Alpha/Beta hydrolase protein [Lentinula lateritia]KAJ4496494.1 Alpha/Beta hydrolase protein [Lentinula lateritia]